MFIGHYALAFGAKKINKLPSLALMFIAVQLLDHLWPIFVLLGIESFTIEAGYTELTPLYSHSLLAAIFWAVIFGGIYFLIKKNKNNALLLGALVISHWVLDLLTHAPDLPLSPFGDTKLGLGLWNYPVVEVIIEFGLFIVGVFYYKKVMQPKRKFAFWSLVVFLMIVYFMNVLGPPPPSIEAVAWSANAMWLMVLWAWWIEKN